MVGEVGELAGAQQEHEHDDRGSHDADFVGPFVHNVEGVEPIRAGEEQHGQHGSNKPKADRCLTCGDTEFVLERSGHHLEE